MRSIRPPVVALAIVAVELAMVACMTGDPARPENGPLPPEAGSALDACTQLPLPDGGPLKVTGRVVHGTSEAGAPIPNAMVAVEYGGVYLPYCDLAHASPYYVFGALTGADGTFSIDVKEGALGLHSFASGYYYSHATLDTSQGKNVTIPMELLPMGQAKPSVADAGFAQGGSVAPGAPITFTVDVRAASASDPLSDELLLVEPTRSFALELDPPGLGKKDNFPNGTWQRTFAAPSEAGTYTYFFSATTGGCVTTDVRSFFLSVQ